MTIASAFNEIAVAQGGTASKSGTITGALDALTDALAGSDQPAPQTIEQGVRMLGEHIGGGGGGAALVGLSVFDTGLEQVLSTSYGSFTANDVEIELAPGYNTEHQVAGLFGTVPAGAAIAYTLPDGKTFDFEEDAPYVGFWAEGSNVEDMLNSSSIWSGISPMQDPDQTPAFNTGALPAMLFVCVKTQV